MNLTMKLTTTCPCHDPITFGHHTPCPRWETMHNDNPPRPPLADGQRYLMNEFQVSRINMTTNEISLAMQRIRSTVEQFHQLMAEVNLTWEWEIDPTASPASPPSQQPDAPA